MSLSVVNNTTSYASGTVIYGQGKMTATGGEIATYGYQYGTTNPPLNSVAVGSGTGIITYNWSRNVGSAGTWYVRAYAYSPASGYKYAAVQSVVVTTAPVVTTTTPSSITMTTATGGGNVTSTGGATVTARGVGVFTSGYVLIKNYASGSGTGSYSVSITGLTENTSYYVRAYATNSIGTGYGSYVAFTTLARPTVTTTTITSIVGNTAVGGGNVTAAGSTSVTARGVCWNTSTNPTIANSKTVDGSGTGTYTSFLTGLTQGTLYYVRAYATNSIGTNYGSNVTFTAEIQVPTLGIDEDQSLFPDLGWSGFSTNTNWSSATHLKLYQKLASAPSYTLVDTIPVTPQTFPVPLSYWKFNETGGTTSVNECRSTPITLGVSNSFVVGKDGNSLKTQNVDYGHADTGIIFGANTVRTLNAWVNLSWSTGGFSGADGFLFSTTDTGRTQGITYGFDPANNEVYYYYINSSGTLVTVSGTHTGITTADEWKMFTFIDLGATVDLYINKVYALSLSSSLTKRNTPIASAIIGGLRYNSGDYVFQRRVWVDEMSVFNKILTPAEINTLYTGVTQTITKIPISNYGQVPNVNYNVYGAFTNGVIEGVAGNIETINNVVANPAFTLSNTLLI